MTQPERIADEWRAQNSDVATPPKKEQHHGAAVLPTAPQDVVPRPMTSDPFRSRRVPYMTDTPPQRPTTADPSRQPLRSQTPKPTRSQTPKPPRPKPPRQDAIPIPENNLFYDGQSETTNGDWLRSQFSKQRTASGLSVPNIDVESPSEDTSPAMTDKTPVDPGLLLSTSGPNAAKDPIQHRAPSIPPRAPSAPSRPPSTRPPSTTPSIPSSTYQIYTKPPPIQPSYPYFGHTTSNATTSSASDTHYGFVPGRGGGEGQMAMKILPPGFVPLSPIPTLTNLTSIPETTVAGGSVSSAGSRSGSSTDSIISRPHSRAAHHIYRHSKPSKDPNQTQIPPAPGPAITNDGDYFTNDHHKQRQLYGLPPMPPGSTDILVMNSRVVSPPPQRPPSSRSSGSVRYRGAGVSPAPLERRLSIFDEDEEDG
ncbi:hypothetical protein NP233_g11559 [Leucocoprinus birnbaumii]|uniref:Uncharacterized protein n=1 Tax=Leucocoprinus birnbaumii TaxID=56174 RepID=A0AAD5YQU9_9AGAR|nr:hypothetical protein NP233_g11559 [Leucocoprinus birnbaumii]